MFYQLCELARESASGPRERPRELPGRPRRDEGQRQWPPEEGARPLAAGDGPSRENSLVKRTG